MNSTRPQRNRSTHRPSDNVEFGDWRVSPSQQVRKPKRRQSKAARVIRRLRVQAAYWESVEPVYQMEPYDESYAIHGWKRVIRLCIAWFLMLPISVVMVFALMLQLYHAAPVVGDVDFWQSLPVWYALLGALVFAVLKYFHLVDAILVFIYVLGHELTHAIAALMCFGKVEALSVDIDGGYVDTDKDNLFVSLAPYFVPLWMLLWLGVFFISNLVVPFETYLQWFYAGFGFWWAFHVYWTLWVIPREQPDLLENGVVISFLIITITNIIALLLILRCFGVISLRGYWQDLQFCAQELYSTYHDLILWVIQR